MRRRPSGSDSEEGDSPVQNPLDAVEPDLDPHVRAEPKHSGEAVRWNNDGQRGAMQKTPSPHRLPKTQTQTRDWKPSGTATNAIDHELLGSEVFAQNSNKANLDGMADFQRWKKNRLPSVWATSLLTLATTLVSALIVYVIVQSFLTRQLDPKGCELSYMRPAFAKYSDFDTEHTRFASKYSLYLYREGGIDEDTRASHIEHTRG